jgi:hypothetical protein
MYRGAPVWRIIGPGEGPYLLLSFLYSISVADLLTHSPSKNPLFLSGLKTRYAGALKSLAEMTDYEKEDTTKNFREKINATSEKSKLTDN